jgi:hypothetical protein
VKASPGRRCHDRRAVWDDMARSIAGTADASAR